jgi:hypothetical protein|tara:strand:+ start:566 stop:868 length:303 start_codon:yes stop_codon:yes gene_type:complete
MYILESHNTYGKGMTMFETKGEAQGLLEAWLLIADGHYPVTLSRVTKMEAIHAYTNYVVDDIRKRKSRSHDDGICTALNHVLCNLFKLQDATKQQIGEIT